MVEVLHDVSMWRLIMVEVLHDVSMWRLIMVEVLHDVIAMWIFDFHMRRSSTRRK